jgi:hypothetical protein
MKKPACVVALVAMGTSIVIAGAAKQHSYCLMTCQCCTVVIPIAYPRLIQHTTADMLATCYATIAIEAYEIMPHVAPVIPPPNDI